MADDTTTTSTDTKSGDDKDTSPTTTSTDTKSGDETLGEAGQKALSEERRARRAAEKSAKDAAAELEKIRAENATEQEKALAAAREEGKSEALKTANARLLRAEVTALASGKLTDPSDAVRHLDLDDFTIGDDGEVDKKAISSAIDELVKEKPYLAGGKNRPAGDGGGGPRGSDGQPSGEDFLRQLVKNKTG